MSVHLSKAELEAVAVVRSITPADFFPRFTAKIREMVAVAREAEMDDDEIVAELVGYYHDMRHDFPTCFYLLARATIRTVVYETADPGPADLRGVIEDRVSGSGSSA